MGDLRISDVVETTRLSARYWQRRAAMGEIPGVASKFSLIIQRGFVFLDVPFARFAPFAMDKTWDEALSSSMGAFTRLANTSSAGGNDECY